MAKGFKSGGRDFQPGQSGNPNGRPPLPDEVKKARKISSAEFIRVATVMMNLTKDEIIAKVKNPETPALELIVASILAKGIELGDDKRLNMLLDRTIGKVTDKVEHKFPKRTVIERYNGQGEVVLGAEPASEDE
jgi:hypothetical protein